MFPRYWHFSSKEDLYSEVLITLEKLAIFYQGIYGIFDIWLVECCLVAGTCVLFILQAWISVFVIIFLILKLILLWLHDIRSSGWQAVFHRPPWRCSNYYSSGKKKNWYPAYFSQFCNLLKIMWTKVFLYCSVQGEELRKLIGAPAYIECSSKTQQVGYWLSVWEIYSYNLWT